MESRLVHWPHHNLWLDRYDARVHLMHQQQLHEIETDSTKYYDLPNTAYCYRASEDSNEDVEERLYGKELYEERFGDMVNEQEIVSMNSKSHDDNIRNDNDKTQILADSLIRREWFPLLKEDVSFPLEKKTLSIMLYTVKAVKEKGTPFEILLKAKTVDANGQLSFLDPQSNYHGFYVYLHQLDNQLFWDIFLGKTGMNSCVKSESLSSVMQYGDDSDDVTKEAITSIAINFSCNSEHSFPSSTPKCVSPENNIQQPVVQMEDLLDYDTDEDEPWGRNNFPSALMRKRKVFEEEDQRKRNRLQAAKLLKGHFLLQSKVSHDSKNEWSINRLCNTVSRDKFVEPSGKGMVHELSLHAGMITFDFH